MLKLFMREYLQDKIQVDSEVYDERFLELVASKTAGFSGRQMSKLVLAWQAAVFGSQAKTLSRALAESVLEWRLEHDVSTAESEDKRTLYEDSNTPK
jgi:ATPase family AAA domain-containing protein 3A/B